MSELRIRAATPDDAQRLLDLYESAQRWLIGQGTDQWANNTREKMHPRFMRSIKQGECYVAEDDAGLVGMVTVDEYADPEFWRPEDEPADALYVHRMVVDRARAGGGIGAALLDWTAKVAASKGRCWLRLDAWRTNIPLHSYYERQGFTPVRIVELAHRGSGALFQRRVNSAG
ncbi:GNAT family N-acetyltransferase [Micromonospora sp. NPDC051196]|uniref:GNAT family N-acetyltransferase n=1 Tax=Micromonospora sp. NPDC051196 TaxID=3155281 RepID=UPI00341C00FC